MDPDKQRALSDFYREEFLRYLEYFKANGILSDDSEDVMQKTVLPLFRRGSSKESIEGTLQDQLRGVGQEAGVRQAL